MRILGQPTIIDDYKRFRAASKGLVSKLRDAVPPFEFDIVKGAKKLTIPTQGRTLIFDEGETETAALMDFYLHEFRAGGRRLIDCCDPEKAWLLADEKALLPATPSCGASCHP
ncbi:MAG: hypothetical protein WBX20_17200, partial [Terrimicrobiaceae bacterium]